MIKCQIIIELSIYVVCSWEEDKTSQNKLQLITYQILGILPATQTFLRLYQWYISIQALR